MLALMTQTTWSSSSEGISFIVLLVSYVLEAEDTVNYLYECHFENSLPNS